jgi:methyl-accepting chemotaxis protein
MSGVAWRIRVALLLQVIATAGTGWLANDRIRPGVSKGGLAALALLVLAVGLLIGLLLERDLVGRLEGLRDVIARTYADGDLTRRAEPLAGRDEIALVASDFQPADGELRNHRRQAALQLDRGRQCFATADR